MIAADRLAAMFDDALRAELAACMDRLAAETARADKAEQDENTDAAIWRDVVTLWETWADEMVVVSPNPSGVRWGHQTMRDKLGDFVRLAKAVDESARPEDLSEAEEERVSTCAYHLCGSPGNCDAGMVHDLIAIIRRRFPKPKPAPKPIHRVAFEASIAAGKAHELDSDEYWQAIADAVVARSKEAL